LKENPTADDYVGRDALGVLALLHAGQASKDERLNPHSPFVASILDQLRQMQMTDPVATYTHSLRAQALSVYNRSIDRGVLDADTRWLINASVKGAYTYHKPPEGTTQPTNFGWDNSNSQYGALGVWAAAEAGFAVPSSYWIDVQSHWEQTQGKNGAWDYNIGGPGTLLMTAAGVNMLFVANETLSAQRPEAQIARPPFSPNLQAGLDWLAQGDNCVTLSAWPFYTLYGMERAGLACGFKMFGNHDWFRDLAVYALQAQNANNGAWGNGEVDTAFALLFL